MRINLDYDVIFLIFLPIVSHPFDPLSSPHVLTNSESCGKCGFFQSNGGDVKERCMVYLQKEQQFCIAKHMVYWKNSLGANGKPKALTLKSLSESS